MAVAATHGRGAGARPAIDREATGVETLSLCVGSREGAAATGAGGAEAVATTGGAMGSMGGFP